MKLALRLFAGVVAAVTLLLTGCQQPQLGQETETAQAMLLWTGEIAADGCGFEVVIDGNKYLPANEDAIDDAFKSSDSTQVQLEFVRLPEQIDRQCGMLPQPRIIDAIRVVSIRRI